MTRIELSDELRGAMLAHAEREAPRECCGLLVLGADTGELHYCPAHNLCSSAGEDRFMLDPETWCACEEFGQIVAVVHSHPNASANPSMADRRGCERSGLPWLIVGWPSGLIVQIEPSGWQAPLVGREFHFGVLDCYTEIQDWYALEWRIELPDFERTDGFWERGEALYREGFPKAGFVEVAGPPQHGDVLLMKIRSEVENHAGVYLEGGLLLHHLYGRLSERVVYGHAWQIRTTAVLRHQSRMVAA